MNRWTVALAVTLSLVVAGQGQPAAITLTGTIRDFNAYNPADFEDGVSFVVDPGIVQTILGVDKKPVYAGGTLGTTHGAAAFDQWYNDVPGVNMSKSYSVTLTNSIAHPDVYTYANNAFFPIDNELLGNEGRDHNFHFTYEIHTQFTYESGQTFEFTGDDDVWVFINDQLAIDLGGVHPAISALVDLDTLGLTPGSTCDFDLFFAERHTTQSDFRIDTSIVLQENPIPEASPFAIWSLLSLLGIAFGWWRQRR
jgi:fibro-slime domain-containing protein